MFSMSRATLALAVLAAAVGTSQGVDFKRVPFTTVDGVKLEGTYYPNPTGKKDATVLLLHNFDHRKGGDSHQDGWDSLAETLQKEGYAVFAFDFRGFGNSKEVGKEFFSHPHNMPLLKKPGQETINAKDFSPAYFPYLVNDIAAAKALLDRKNDASELNTSNLVLVGAGEGATVGALWLAAQCRLQRDRNPPAVIALPPALDEPEAKDVAAAVWLTISPTLAGRMVEGSVKSSLVEAGKDHKVPMAFIYGDDDKMSKMAAKKYKDAIMGGPKKIDVLTGEQGIKNAKVTGSKLLSADFDTEKWIVDNYLNAVLDKRGSRERIKRDIDKHQFYWKLTRMPGPGPGLRAKILPGSEMISIIPLDRLGILNGGLP